jgi:hypothetical protein
VGESAVLLRACIPTFREFWASAAIDPPKLVYAVDYPVQGGWAPELSSDVGAPEMGRAHYA